MAANDTLDLIAQIKRRCFIPTNQSTYSNADFAGLLNDSMRLWLVPQIRRVRANYFMTKTDLPIVSGQDTFAVPSRAMGAAIRYLQYIYNGGNALRRLPEIELQDMQNIATVPNGMPQGYYWNGNNLTIYPNPTASQDLLRLFWFLRPNQMVTPDLVGIIQSISTNQVTLTATPPSGFSSGALYDIVQAAPPFGSLCIDNPASISGNTLTFTNPLTTGPTAPAVGDQVCLAQQAAVAQVPLELQPGLVQRAICFIYEATDPDLLASGMGELQKFEQDIPTHITPRSEGNPRKAINRVWM